MDLEENLETQKIHSLFGSIIRGEFDGNSTELVETIKYLKENLPEYATPILDHPELWGYSS